MRDEYLKKLHRLLDECWNQVLDNGANRADAYVALYNAINNVNVPPAPQWKRPE